jgi:hypothetical protein
MYVAVNETGDDQFAAIVCDCEIGGKFLLQGVSRTDIGDTTLINDE